MADTSKQNNSKLKKVSTFLVSSGIIVFIIGFFLQFLSVAMFDIDTDSPFKFFIVIIAGFFMLFAGIMLSVFERVNKFRKLQGGILDKMLNSIENDNQKDTRMREQDVYCDYCGSMLHENERECPNCGAARTERKK